MNTPPGVANNTTRRECRDVRKPGNFQETSMSKQTRTDVLSLTVPVSADNVNPALTATEIQAQIDAITQELKGPLCDIERGFLVADRRELKARLAEIEDALKGSRA